MHQSAWIGGGSYSSITTSAGSDEDQATQRYQPGRPGLDRPGPGGHPATALVPVSATGAVRRLRCLHRRRISSLTPSRSNLVGSNKRYHQIYMAFREEFPTQDDLVVVVESENAEKNRQFVERLGTRLEAETNLFSHVFFRGRPEHAGGQGAAVCAGGGSGGVEADGSRITGPLSSSSAAPPTWSRCST